MKNLSKYQLLAAGAALALAVAPLGSFAQNGAAAKHAMNCAHMTPAAAKKAMCGKSTPRHMMSHNASKRMNTVTTIGTPLPAGNMGTGTQTQPAGNLAAPAQPQPAASTGVMNQGTGGG